MRICLELTSDPGGWSGHHRSILSILSIHSIPSQWQPMRIRLGLIPGTRLILASIISRPKEAGSSNSANDLVETTSPGHHSCSAQSGLVETTSPGPQQGLVKALLLSYCFNHRPVEVIPPCQQLRLSLKEELSPSLRAAATRCSITRSHSHAWLILILYLKWDLSLQ